MDEMTRTALNELLRSADQREDLELAWQAGAGAAEILLWSDEFTRAAGLAETLIRDLGPRGTGLDDQVQPFTAALLAADAFAGEPALPRVKSAAALLPDDSPLGQQLTRAGERLLNSGASEYLALRRPWSKKGRPPGRSDREVLEQDWNGLEGTELRRLWGAVMRSNDYALAQQVMQVRGEAPTDWACVMWLAQWFIHDDQRERATELLRRGRESYLPHAPWNLLPLNPPVDPLLRTALTPAVRQAYLDGMREPFTDPFA